MVRKLSMDLSDDGNFIYIYIYIYIYNYLRLI